MKKLALLGVVALSALMVGCSSTQECETSCDSDKECKPALCETACSEKAQSCSSEAKGCCGTCKGEEAKGDCCGTCKGEGHKHGEGHGHDH